MQATSLVERGMDLPGGPRSVGLARRFLCAVLQEAGVAEDVIDIAVLLLSELVTNSVLHAGTPVSIRCLVQAPKPMSGERIPGVLVEVTDGSILLPAPRAHDREAVTGRGLELVALLAERSGVRTTERGKTVWFCLSGADSPVDVGWASPVDALRPAVTVELRDVPVLLYAVVQEHNESLLREFELFRLSADEVAGHRTSQDYSQQDIIEAARARVSVANAVRAAGAGVGLSADGMTPSGDPPPPLEVAVVIPSSDVEAYERLLGVFDAAETAAAAGALLTRPALPELLALRDWMFGQVVHQIHGGQPVPWVSADAVLPAPRAEPVAVDLGWVRQTSRAVVVADDANRMIAVSDAAAELLGWAAEDLAGQRLTAIIPPALREAHVTGFTRQLVTGRDTLIGREVTVPALHRDGSEVPVLLRLERVAAGTRTVYLGWLGLPVTGSG